MSLFDVIRLRRQAPTSRPPAGYYDLRVSKATGQVVFVDSDGAETPLVGSVSSVAGRTGEVTIASADITDATSDGATNKGKVLKSNAGGQIIIQGASFGTGGVASPVFYVQDLAQSKTTTVQTDGVLTDNRTVVFPDASGRLAVMPAYATNAAAVAGGLSPGVDIYWDTAAKAAKVVQTS